MKIHPNFGDFGGFWNGTDHPRIPPWKRPPRELFVVFLHNQWAIFFSWSKSRDTFPPSVKQLWPRKVYLGFNIHKWSLLCLLPLFSLASYEGERIGMAGLKDPAHLLVSMDMAGYFCLNPLRIPPSWFWIFLLIILTYFLKETQSYQQIDHLSRHSLLALHLKLNVIQWLQRNGSDIFGMRLTIAEMQVCYDCMQLLHNKCAGKCKKIIPSCNPICLFGWTQKIFWFPIPHSKFLPRMLSKVGMGSWNSWSDNNFLPNPACSVCLCVLPVDFLDQVDIFF